MLCFALFLLCLIPRAVSAASPLFLDSFGSTSSEFVQGWIEDERYGWAHVVSPGARPESPTEGFAALKEASITRTVTTVGYQNITLSYYWRGLPTAFPGDYLYVYWRPVGGSSFLLLDSHPLSSSSSWSASDTISLPPEASDTDIELMFYGSFDFTLSHDSEAQVDDVEVSGDFVSVDLTRGSLMVLKEVQSYSGTNNYNPNDPTSFTVRLHDGIKEIRHQVSEVSYAYFPALLPGTYTLTEDTPRWHIFTSFSYDEDGNAGNGAQITIHEGESLSLTITNIQYPGLISLEKFVYAADGVTDITDPHPFTFTLTGTQGHIITSTFTEAKGKNINVDPNVTYTITESPEPGYEYVGCGMDIENFPSTVCTARVSSGSSTYRKFKNLNLSSSYSLLIGNLNGRIITKEGNPWYAPYTLTLNAGETFTIRPGVIIKFDPTAQFQVSGHLIVNGNEQEPVILTSAKDDTDGTDVTLDGPTTPTPGDWQGMVLAESSNCSFTLHNLELRYATTGINHQQFTYSACPLILQHLAFHHNTVGLNTPLPVDIRGSSFSGNNTAIFHWYTDQPVDARDSSWGDNSGPTYSTNPLGIGDSLIALTPILYDPWVGKGNLPMETHEPVIVVPGLMGSAWVPGKGWQIDPILHVYDNLLASLTDIYGSERVYSFPYNWREDNAVSGHLLKQKIKEVKQAAGAIRVDLVVHSMGGLVARSYIESDEYAGDVDQLIMMGTPNKGSPKVYSFWEAFEGFEEIYEQILKQLFIFESLANGYTSPLRYIRNEVLSISQLLPNYSYLIEDDTGGLRPYPTNYPTNPFLDTLNTSSLLSRLYQRIQVSTITNDALSTLAQIKVGAPEQDKWEHGVWTKKIIGSGDETVPIESALTPSTDPNFSSIGTLNVYETHLHLPTASIVKVIRTLTGRVYNLNNLSPVHKKVLLVSLHSPADMVITDQYGNRVGTDPSTGLPLTEIEDSYTTGPDDAPEFITIPNPEDTEYKITLTGTGSGGEVTMEAILIDEGLTSPDPLIDPEPPTATTTLTIAPGETKEFKVYLDEITSEEPIVILPADTKPPVITITSPLPDTVYEHHQIITLSSTLTDASPVIYATTTVDDAIKGVFTSPTNELIAQNSLDLPTLHLGTHMFTVEGQDSLYNTISTSTLFSIISTPSSILKMFDYGIIHGWFPDPRVVTTLRNLIDKLTPIVNNPPPLTPILRIKALSFIDAALRALNTLYQLHKITPEGYGILREDLIYVKNHL
ncbi:MAG: hypothetical protein WC659_01050 [Patescibacteria group bacterium]